MAEEDRTYTRAEVIAGGFEARCVDGDGTRYLWHGAQGLRTDARHCVTTLITRPSSLPDGPWFATELGRREIAEAATED